MRYSLVVLVYLGDELSCQRLVELFVVSQSTPLVVVMTNCFLIPIVGMLVVIKVDQYWITSFVLVYSCFEMLDTSVSWGFTKEFVRFDYYVPWSFGAFG